MNVSVSVALVVANALPKVLDDIVVGNSGTLVVAERVVLVRRLSV